MNASPAYSFNPLWRRLDGLILNFGKFGILFKFFLHSHESHDCHAQSLYPSFLTSLSMSASSSTATVSSAATASLHYPGDGPPLPFFPPQLQSLLKNTKWLFLLWPTPWATCWYVRLGTLLGTTLIRGGNTTMFHSSLSSLPKRSYRKSASIVPSSLIFSLIISDDCR